MDFGAVLEFHNSILANNGAPLGEDVSLNRMGSLINLASSTVDSGGSSIHTENGGAIGSIDFVYALAPGFADPDGPDTIL